MRILTWNVNVLRTCLDYHPFSSMKKKNVEGLLDELGAEIACFQEHKTRRAQLEKSMACPGPYDAFWTFPRSKTGYSGVCTYVDSRYCVPIKAEEGITGLLLDDKASTMRPPWTGDERVGCYPEMDEIRWEDEEGVGFDPRRLDMEGRAVVVDLGPNETNDSRRPYKMNFLHCLQERVRLLMAAGRNVIIVGDINIMRAPIDSGEGGIRTSAAQHYEHPARVILNDWIAPKGPMIDVVRESWPDREDMFTCWNQKLDARPSNYGSRIDLILCSPGLRPWIKGGDILPKIYGSDHCPVYIDLHEEIDDPVLGKVRLRDALNPSDRAPSTAPLYPQDPPRTVPEPPRFATKFFDEFSGKQRTLKSFFAGGGAGRGAAVGCSSGEAKKVKEDKNQKDLERRNASPVAAAENDVALPATKDSKTATTPSTVSKSTTATSDVPSTPFGIARAAFSHLDDPGPSRRRSSPPLASGSARLDSIRLEATEDDDMDDIVPIPRPTTQRASSSDVRATKISKSSQTSSSKGPVSAPGSRALSNASNGQKSIAAFFSAPSVTPDLDDREGKTRKRPSSDRDRGRKRKPSLGSSAITGASQSRGGFPSRSPTKSDLEIDTLGYTSDEHSSTRGTTAYTTTDADAEADPDGSESSAEQVGGADADASIAAAIAAADAEAESKRAEQKAQQAPIWNSLFAKKLPPLCTVHRQPCKEFISKVPGTKGKRFWLCSLPVGAGYDSGRSKRKREDVNPNFRCDFFLWDSANSRREPTK